MFNLYSAVKFLAAVALGAVGMLAFGTLDLLPAVGVIWLVVMSFIPLGIFVGGAFHDADKYVRELANTVDRQSSDIRRIISTNLGQACAIAQLTDQVKELQTRAQNLSDWNMKLENTVDRLSQSTAVPYEV